MSAVRQKLAEWIWGIGNVVGPNRRERPNQDEREWEVTQVFSATEAEAHEIFDRVVDAVCTCSVDTQHYCRCSGGGLRPFGDEDEPQL